MLWEALRHSVLLETGMAFGPLNGVYPSSSRSTSAIIIPGVANASWSGMETAQLWIFLPNAATADRERPAGVFNPTTGSIPNEGKVWSGTAGIEQAELQKWISPTELFNVMVSAFMEIDQTELHPLGAFEDNDCNASTAGAWSAVNANLNKSTSKVRTGRRSLRVTLTGAGGYASGGVVTVTPGKQVYASATFLADVGTGRFVLYDLDNNAEIGDGISYNGERFAHAELLVTVPSGCERIEVRAAGVNSGDDIYFDHFSGPWVLDGDFNIAVPSTLNESWRFRKLREARYSGTITGPNGESLKDARTRQFQDWAQKQDVNFIPLPSDANPYELQLTKPPPQNDLWIEYLRSAYDMLSAVPANTADDETIETDLPDQEVVLKVSLAVCDYIVSKDPTNNEARLNGGRIEKKLANLTAAKEVDLAPQDTVVYRGGLGRRV